MCIVLSLKRALCLLEYGFQQSVLLQKKPLSVYLNDVNPYQHLISPYTIKTLSSKQVMRLKTDHKLILS